MDCTLAAIRSVGAAQRFFGQAFEVTYSHPANPFHTVDFDPARLGGGSFQGAVMIDAAGAVAGAGASKGSTIVMDHPFNDVAGCIRPARGPLANDTVLACASYTMSMVTLMVGRNDAPANTKTFAKVVRSPTRTDGEPPAAHHPIFETVRHVMVLQGRGLSYHVVDWQLGVGYANEIRFTANSEGTVSPPIYFRHKGGCNSGYPRAKNLPTAGSEKQLVNGAVQGVFYGADYMIVRIAAGRKRGPGILYSKDAPGTWEGTAKLACQGGIATVAPLPAISVPRGTFSVTRNAATGDVTVSGEACMEDKAGGTLRGVNVHITHPATSSLVASAGNTGAGGAGSGAARARVFDRIQCVGTLVGLEDGTPQRYMPGAGGVDECVAKCEASAKCDALNWDYTAKQCAFLAGTKGGSNDLRGACYPLAASECTRPSGATLAFSVVLKRADLAARGVNDYRGLAVLASDGVGGGVRSRAMVGHVANTVILGPPGQPVIDPDTVVLATDKDITDKLPEILPDVMSDAGLAAYLASCSSRSGCVSKSGQAPKSTTAGPPTPPAPRTTAGACTDQDAALVALAATGGWSVSGCSDPRAKSQCSNSQVAALCCTVCASTRGTTAMGGTTTRAPAAGARIVDIQQSGEGWKWAMASGTAGVVASESSSSFPAINLLEGDQVTFHGTTGQSHWFALIAGTAHGRTGNPQAIIDNASQSGGNPFVARWTATPGQFTYYCPPHGDMKGMITVRACNEVGGCGGGSAPPPTATVANTASADAPTTLELVGSSTAPTTTGPAATSGDATGGQGGDYTATTLTTSSACHVRRRGRRTIATTAAALMLAAAAQLC